MIAVLLVALGVTMVVQAQRVRRERDRATAEAAKASAIDAFLLDALGAADPWQKGSRNVSLLEALRQAQDKAQTSFANQPLVEASVLQTIGTTFTNLAEFPEAEKALKAALDLRVKAAGARTAEAAESMGALANMYSLWRKFDEAVKYAREAVDVTRELHGEKSLETAVRTYDLANALFGAGKPAEARALAEEMLRIVRERGQVRTPEAAKAETDALLILITVATSEEDFKKLTALTHERLELLKKRLGDRHPEVVQALSDVALGQNYLGDFAGAERTFLEAIEMDIALLGPDHPEVAVGAREPGERLLPERPAGQVREEPRGRPGDAAEGAGRRFGARGAHDGEHGHRLQEGRQRRGRRKDLPRGDPAPDEEARARASRTSA